MKWSIANIKIPDPSRINPDTRSRSLMASINELGLLCPITILPDGTLISGYRRLEACRQLDWKEIDVHIVNLDPLRADLAQIDANLMINKQYWIDDAKQTVRRKEIFEELDPEGVVKWETKSEARKSDLQRWSLTPYLEHVDREDGTKGKTVIRRAIRNTIEYATFFEEDKVSSFRVQNTSQDDIELHWRYKIRGSGPLYSSHQVFCPNCDKWHSHWEYSHTDPVTRKYSKEEWYHCRKCRQDFLSTELRGKYGYNNGEESAIGG